jgi:hypothetical protein
LAILRSAPQADRSRNDYAFFLDERGRMPATPPTTLKPPLPRPVMSVMCEDSSNDDFFAGLSFGFARPATNELTLTSP